MDAENIKQSIQAVVDGLTPLAQKLQIPLEHVWRWSVKHNYAIAISELCAWIFIMILAIPLYKLYKYGMTKEKADDYGHRLSNSEGLVVGTVIYTICWGLAFVALTICLFSDVIPRLVAPEFYTAQDLIFMVKGQNN